MAGAKIVHDRSGDVRQALNRELSRAVTNAVSVAHGVSSREAPVDTGNLANSIRSETSGVTGEVFTDVHYAVHQEYGTATHAAQPFMQPGADAAKRYLSSDAVRDLRRAAEEAAR